MMKKFLIKTLLFLSMLMISFYRIFSHANGYTDPYYIRFATPRQSSLILGTSRAAQGLQPQILNHELNRNDLFNYAFTMEHSPFGKVYFESIKRKLNQKTKDGIFIVCVDPWSISSKSENPNDILNFRENNLALGTRFVNLTPNIIYLLKYYNGPYIKLFKKDSSFFVHDDGWLEISVSMDFVSKQTRLEKKMNRYEKEKLPQYKFSSLRYTYLSKTIRYLQSYGKVYLVRLPIHPRIMGIENRLISDFTGKMNYLCKTHNVKYLSFEDELLDYEYTDGNHLWKKSSEKVSAKIANWIRAD